MQANTKPSAAPHLSSQHTPDTHPLGLQELQMRHLGRLRVSSESILLAVGAAENEVAGQLQQGDAAHGQRRQMRVVVY